MVPLAFEFGLIGVVSATVILTPINFDDDFHDRAFVLDSASPPMKIGRASRSGTRNLCSAHDNAYIDSPVMSREHATFRVDDRLVSVPIGWRTPGDSL